MKQDARQDERNDRWPWGGVAFFVLFALAVLFVIEERMRSHDDDPCAVYIDGYSETTDDMGRRAFVPHRWCAVWKPGREPKP